MASEELIDAEPAIGPGITGGLLAQPEWHVRPESLCRNLSNSLRARRVEVRRQHRRNRATDVGKQMSGQVAVRIAPAELEDFDETFRLVFLPIRETFHADGRYEVTNTLGGPACGGVDLIPLSLRANANLTFSAVAPDGKRAYFVYQLTDPCVAVVNIDNGFGAGLYAHTILKRIRQPEQV